MLAGPGYNSSALLQSLYIRIGPIYVRSVLDFSLHCTGFSSEYFPCDHDVPMMKLRVKFYFVVSGEINIVIHKNWWENEFTISDISLYPVRTKREY